jgi:hypothetical protein
MSRTLVGALIGAAATGVAVGAVAVTAKLTAWTTENRVRKQLLNIVGTTPTILEQANTILRQTLENLDLGSDAAKIYDACCIKDLNKNPSVPTICVEMMNDFENNSIMGWFDGDAHQAHEYYKEIMTGVQLYLQTQGVIKVDLSTNTPRLTEVAQQLTQGTVNMLMFGNVLALCLAHLAITIQTVPTTDAELEEKTKAIRKWGARIEHFIRIAADSEGLLSQRGSRAGQTVKDLLGIETRRTKSLAYLLNEFEEAKKSKLAGGAIVETSLGKLTTALVNKAKTDYDQACSSELLKCGLTVADEGFLSLMMSTQSLGDSIASEVAPTNIETYRKKQFQGRNNFDRIDAKIDMSENLAFINYALALFDETGEIIKFPTQAPKVEFGSFKIGKITPSDSSSYMDVKVAIMMTEKIISMLGEAYNQEVNTGGARSPLAYFLLSQMKIGLSENQKLHRKASALDLDKKLIDRSVAAMRSQAPTSNRSLPSTTVNLQTSDETLSTRENVDIATSLNDPEVKSTSVVGADDPRNDQILKTVVGAKDSVLCFSRRRELGWLERQKQLVQHLLDRFDMDPSLTNRSDLSKLTPSDHRVKALSMLAALGATGADQRSPSFKEMATSWVKNNEKWIVSLTPSASSSGGGSKEAVNSANKQSAVLEVADKQVALTQAMHKALQAAQAFIHKFNSALQVKFSKNPQQKKAALEKIQKELGESPFIEVVSGTLELRVEKMITLSSFANVKQSLETLQLNYQVIMGSVTPTEKKLIQDDLAKYTEEVAKLPLVSSNTALHEMEKMINEQKAKSNQALEHDNKKLAADLDRVSEDLVHANEQLEEAHTREEAVKKSLADIQAELQLTDASDVAATLLKLKDDLAKATTNTATAFTSYDKIVDKLVTQLVAQQEKWKTEADVQKTAHEALIKAFETTRDEALAKATGFDDLSDRNQKTRELIQSIYQANVQLEIDRFNSTRDRMLLNANSLKDEIEIYKQEIVSARGEGHAAVTQLTAVCNNLDTAMKAFKRIEAKLDVIQGMLVGIQSVLENQQTKAANPARASQESSNSPGDVTIQLSKKGGKSVAFESKEKVINVLYKDFLAKRNQYDTTNYDGKDKTRAEDQTKLFNSLCKLIGAASTHRSKVVTLLAGPTRSALNVVSTFFNKENVNSLNNLITLLRQYTSSLQTKWENTEGIGPYNQPHSFRILSNRDMRELTDLSSKRCLTPRNLLKILEDITRIHYGLNNKGEKPSFTGGSELITPDDWIKKANEYALTVMDPYAHRSTLSRALTTDAGAAGTTELETPRAIFARGDEGVSTTAPHSPSGQGGVGSDEDSDEDSDKSSFKP